MTVLRNEGRWDRSNVIYQPGRVMLYDKAAAPGMQYIDYGLSCFHREVFDDQVTSSDLAVLFHDLSVKAGSRAFEVHERFYEIGSPAGLRDFERIPPDSRSRHFLAIIVLDASHIWKRQDLLHRNSRHWTSPLG